MRLHDWQLRYAKECNKWRDAPFKWGEHDCCLWAANIVLALTGQDFANDLRFSYDSALGAAKVLERLGGVEAIATAALGEPVPVLMAGVGDIVCIDQEGRRSLAVCNGTNVLAVAAAGGLAVLPLTDAVLLWKV